jgi:hypothetical protein
MATQRRHHQSPFSYLGFELPALQPVFCLPAP